MRFISVRAMFAVSSSVLGFLSSSCVTVLSQGFTVEITRRLTLVDSRCVSMLSDLMRLLSSISRMMGVVWSRSSKIASTSSRMKPKNSRAYTMVNVCVVEQEEDVVFVVEGKCEQSGGLIEELWDTFRRDGGLAVR